MDWRGFDRIAQVGAFDAAFMPAPHIKKRSTVYKPYCALNELARHSGGQEYFKMNYSVRA